MEFTLCIRLILKPIVKHGRTAWGGRGLPKVLPGLARPYGHFWGGPPAGHVALSRLRPFWTPHAVRLCLFYHPPDRILVAAMIRQMLSG
jgi:hypothetical protein